jgi:hypothetical protein
MKGFLRVVGVEGGVGEVSMCCLTNPKIMKVAGELGSAGLCCCTTVSIQLVIQPNFPGKHCRDSVMNCERFKGGRSRLGRLGGWEVGCLSSC